MPTHQDGVESRDKAYFVCVFVYTIIRARAVRTSLLKTLNAEEFLFLSHGEPIS